MWASREQRPAGADRAAREASTPPVLWVPVSIMWAGRSPANAGPSTCGHGAPGPPPFWLATLARGVLTLVVVTGEAVNRYLKEELLWLISTLTP